MESTMAHHTVKQFVHHLHNSVEKPHKFTLYTSGAGQSCIKWLLDVSGASRSILEMRVPYALASVDRCLRGQSLHGSGSMSHVRNGKFMFKSVSSQLNMRLARDAYHRSLDLQLREEELSASQREEIIENMDTASTAAGGGGAGAGVTATAEGIATDASVVGYMKKCFGLSCTASVRTNYPKQGKHHFYVNLYAWNVHREYYLNMNKTEVRSREEEDEMIGLVLMQALADQCVAEEGNGNADEELCHWRDKLNELVKEKLLEGERIVKRVENLQDKSMIGQGAPVAILSTSSDEFYEGGIGYVAVDLLHGKATDAVSSNHANLVQHLLPSQSTLLVFPGSFNPLHVGHLDLVKQARQTLIDDQIRRNQQNPRDIAVAFEITAVNADKPALSSEQIHKRTMQFFADEWRQRLEEFRQCFLLLTKMPLFVQKAQMFAKSNGRLTYFVIGVDTMRRLVDNKYYDNSASKMVLALSDFYSRYNIRFIVGGRLDKKTGQFVSMNDLLQEGLIPAGFEDLFLQIPEDQFRTDISSTEIRAQDHTKAM